MAFVPKARDLPQTLTGATIRLAQRESFDMRSATAVPSATGGAPPQIRTGTIPEMTLGKVDFPTADTMPPLAAPLAKLEDRAATEAERQFWRGRDRRERQPIVPFLLRSRRPIEHYSTLNEGFVNEVTNAIQAAAQVNPDWAGRVETLGGPQQFALALVAAVQQAYELESEGIDLPTQIHSTRRARKLRGWLDDLVNPQV